MKGTGATTITSGGNSMNYDYLFKVILIGDAACGKSSLMLRYVEDRFPESYNCTIGVDFKMKSLKTAQEKIVKLQIWDTAGQERFRPITRSYYRGAHACIIVYDLSKRESFDHVHNWLEQFQNDSAYTSNVIIVGNKCDLDSREVTESEGRSYATQLGYQFMECSAKTDTNVSKLFEKTVDMVMRELQVSNNLNGSVVGEKSGGGTGIEGLGGARSSLFGEPKPFQRRSVRIETSSDLSGKKNGGCC